MSQQVVIFLSIFVGVAMMVTASLWLWLNFQRELQKREASIREDARREGVVLAKEEAQKFREEAERDIKDQRREIQRLTERLEAKEHFLDSQRQQLHDREATLASAQQQSAQTRQEAEDKLAQAEAELARAANLSREEAQQTYLARLESEFRDLGARQAKQVQQSSLENAQSIARNIALEAMQRSMAEYVTEATVSVITLPSEDMKGRLIGREGRNIRAFEQVAGVDLIIDETPEAVMISSFDPVRREIARIALQELIEDGRIHPVRIEELHEKATQHVQKLMTESGLRASEESRVMGLSQGVLDMMGRLRFRASFGQNVLDHSIEVARMAQIMADELGFNRDVARRAGLLHDIGKALGPEWEGPHALTGMEFLKQQGEAASVLNAVGAHHQEIEPLYPESWLVIAADTLSAARPGARRESLENHTKRLADLERIALSFEGVDRVYAVQSGREVRLLVRPEAIDDLGAARLANAMARRVETETAYPGQIKITVIRESRYTDFAK